MEPVRILVIDDEPGIASLCERILTRAGYVVAALTDPREAVEWLERNKAALLLVDIRMPIVDGFQVIAHANRLQPDIAVLVMTGFGTLDTAMRALRQGVDGLLLKPFESGDELAEAVGQALSESKRRQDAARIQALRPLFEVTESLFSETRTDSLLELIISAILGQLRCTHGAYYEYSDEEGRFSLRAGQGKQLPEYIIQVDASGSPVLANSSGPGDSQAQARLLKAGLGAAMFVPIARQGLRGVFFAGRDPGEPGFLAADQDMLQILARQASAALENARLYDEERSYVRRIEESQTALLQAEKMAAAGRLSASIAHEINNPLQSIENCLHLADRDDLPEATRREYFELARAEVERLSVTVERMQDFHRPGAAKAERVQVYDLLKYIVNLTEKQLKERGIAMAMEVSQGLPEVWAVSSQLQQVFMNLILNSYDAMPDGGNVHITGRRIPNGIEILFEDDGLGVPKEDASSIFEPFFTTKDEGTGLGLTISYNIVTAHGGSLELVPNHGKGACFRVFLPIGESP
jgi:signal transduction histidine kinase/CheY-like chemotaxis protein